jgi:hypothetical protein
VPETLPSVQAVDDVLDKPSQSEKHNILTSMHELFTTPKRPLK